MTGTSETKMEKEKPPKSHYEKSDFTLCNAVDVFDEMDALDALSKEKELSYLLKIAEIHALLAIAESK